MPVDFGEGEYSFLNESRWWKWSFCWKGKGNYVGEVQQSASIAYLVKNILQCIASTKNSENYLLFWCSCFLQELKKRKLSIAHSLLEKEKTSVTSPMKVTIGPETIVITNLCHYRRFHHHHIPLWVMEASKQWSFRLKKENIEQAWNKIRIIQEIQLYLAV